MDKDDREELLAAWIADQSSHETERELLEELRADEEFRRTAAKHLIVHRLLDQKQIPEGDFTAQVMATIETDPEDSTFADETVVKLQSYRRHRLRWTFAAVASAVVASLAFAIVFWPPDSLTPPESIRVVATEGIGTLDFERLHRGDEISLRRGILELELNDEARVVFEAPSVFSIVSPLHVKLASGRCYAEMGAGLSGLRIETPSGEVLDLGTRFAVEVPTATSMNVHVFEGEVEVSEPDGPVRLKEGHGLERQSGGMSQSVVAQPNRFVPKVPRAVEVRGLYWGFDEGQRKRVAVRAAGGMEPRGDGVRDDNVSETDGPKFVPGRYGTALEFNGVGQWVRTRHPGIEGGVDRTVACWVRLPEDWGEGDRRGPMISWGLKRPDVEDQAWNFGINGVLKWNTKVAGRLRLGVGRQSTSGSTDLRDGHWHHVAAVSISGSDRPTILFYVDGELEQVTRGEIESIHTETTEDRSQSVRFGRRVASNLLYLRGTLDEVYILEGALSGDQVRALMRNELAGVFRKRK